MCRFSFSKSNKVIFTPNIMGDKLLLKVAYYSFQKRKLTFLKL